MLIEHVNASHFQMLMDHSLIDTIQHIIEEFHSEHVNCVVPICCFHQKTGIFYVCENQQWRRMAPEEFVLLVKRIQNALIRELSHWKVNNQHLFDDDKLSIRFNKAVIKVMDLKDSAISRMKHNFHNYMKKDMSAHDIDYNETSL